MLLSDERRDSFSKLARLILLLADPSGLTSMCIAIIVHQRCRFARAGSLLQPQVLMRTYLTVSFMTRDATRTRGLRQKLSSFRRQVLGDIFAWPQGCHELLLGLLSLFASLTIFVLRHP